MGQIINIIVVSVIFFQVFGCAYMLWWIFSHKKDNLAGQESLVQRLYEEMGGAKIIDAKVNYDKEVLYLEVCPPFASRRFVIEGISGCYGNVTYEVPLEKLRGVSLNEIALLFIKNYHIYQERVEAAEKELEECHQKIASLSEMLSTFSVEPILKDAVDTLLFEKASPKDFLKCWGVTPPSTNEELRVFIQDARTLFTDKSLAEKMGVPEMAIFPMAEGGFYAEVEYFTRSVQDILDVVRPKISVS